MNRKRKERGTTLAELAAGTTFVAVALVGTVAAIASGSTLARTTAETREAQRVAANLMEEVRATDADELVATFDGISRSLDGVGGSHSGTASVSVTRVDDGTTIWGVYQVGVDVAWERANEPRVIRMVAYVSDRAYGSGVAVQQEPPPDDTSTTTSDGTTTTTGTTGL